MSRPRSDTPVRTTAGALSRAADRILSRFPDGSRPSKNLLLNDIAGAISPGRNWGGLKAQRPSPEAAPESSVPLPVVPEAAPGALELSARVRTCSPDDSPVGEDIMWVGALCQHIWGRQLHGGRVMGLRLVAKHEGGRHDCWLHADLLLVDGPDVRVRHLCPQEHGHDMAGRVFELIQGIDSADFAADLGRFGDTNVAIFLGPFDGYAVTSLAAQEHLHLESIDAELLATIGEDVTIILHAEDEGVPDPGSLARACGVVGHFLSDTGVLAGGARPIRLSADHVARPDVRVTPLGRGMPLDAERPRSLFHATRHGPSVEAYKTGPEVDGRMLDYVLGEALAFVLDWCGLPPGQDIFLDCRVRHFVDIRASGDKRIINRLGEGWIFVTRARDGNMAQWRLADRERDAHMRSCLEAYLAREGFRVVPRVEVTGEGSCEALIVPPINLDRLNRRRAREIFANLKGPQAISQAGESM